MIRFPLVASTLILAVACWSVPIASAQGFLPRQPELELVGTETYVVGDRAFTRYKLAVTNWSYFPDDIFERIGDGTARTHVTIRNVSGKSIYGFATLIRRQDLTHLWFSVEVGQLPPRAVYVELNDRVEKLKQRSNAIRLY